MKKISRIVLGIDILLFGILIGLKILDIIDFSSLFSGWWTIFIIVPSISYLVTSKDKAISLIFLMIGILLLLASLSLIDFSIVWKLIIPVILVGIGLSFIISFFSSKKVIDSNEYTSTFGKELLEVTKKYTGGKLNAIFAILDCNLSEAVISSDIIIETTGVFGKVILDLPDNVNIIVREFNIFGSCRVLKNKNNKNNINTVFINAKSIFGGVDIK